MDTKKIVEFLKSKTFLLIIGFLGLFLVAAGVSWAVFSLTSKGTTGTSIISGLTGGGKNKINLNLPKTEACPINGALFTKPEKDTWTKHRPIAAQIENHADSRPPSGLSKADVVYEAVAEGGITRFLGIFYCGVAMGNVQIAPVRSSRIYFINWASEYADFPIYMHIGGANDYSGSGDTAPKVRALETLENIGWRTPGGNDFDTTYDSGFPVFWRNYERLTHEVPTEHTMMASIDAAYDQADKRGFGATHNGVQWDATFTPWKFMDDKALGTPKSSDISFQFWSDMPDYNVEWKYDAASNSYLRFDGGQPHVDLEYNNAQLSAKNVIVQFVVEQGPLDRNMHMFYQNIGTGDALVFQNGDVIKGTWTKDARTDRTIFTDATGKEIKFVRGVIWVEAVPAGNTVKY